MERRSVRSREPGVALRQYLLSLTRKHRPKAIVLADMKGKVIAGVEGRPFMEEGFIAARAPETVGHDLAKQALADLEREKRVQEASKKRFAKLRGRFARIGESLRRRNRQYVPQPPRTARTLEVGNSRFLLVVVGGADAAPAEATAGLQRILAAV